MSQDWADNIAQKLISRNLIQIGTCLILGAADTGKTTLAAALAKRLAPSRPIGIVDADIGQSHIGPPTTVGWAVATNPPPLLSSDRKTRGDLWQLPTASISFVGDVTPVGHLLQLTAAIIQSVEQASKVTELIIVDTPGFITGPAASALWWTVQRVLNPKLILAVERNNELSDILAGLHRLGPHLELVKSPPQIKAKSPQDRRAYRQSQFNKYFQNSLLHNINLSDMAVQVTWNSSRNNPVSHIAALRNQDGMDVAIGIIKDWQSDKNTVVLKAPQLDIRQISCLVIGDATIDIAEG
jgi:polynucleotide 5'-hydroxyl-kinase GRC3/NOL9